MKLSIVSPVYNSAGSLKELVAEIDAALQSASVEYEVIFVNDASPDNAWEVITSLAQSNGRVKGVNLSRNFGQHPAILAGLSEANGDVCVVMDADLQDDPKYIPELIKKYEEGFDVVFTSKSSRQHGAGKNFWAWCFNKVFNWLSDSKTVRGKGDVGAYSLISRKVVDAFLSYSDYQFHYLQVLMWMGFKSSSIEIEHRGRKEGKSSYNFSRMLSHAIVAILYHSDKLLRLNVLFGFVLAFLSFLFGLYIVITTYLYGYQAGWPSLIVVILFSTGLILSSIGVVGLYVAKSFEQVKGRPRFIISERTS